MQATGHDVGVNATAHQLRHWHGTALYAGTHDLRLVQEVLGHASPSTTAVYVQFDPQEAIEAVAALSFRPGATPERARDVVSEDAS